MSTIRFRVCALLVSLAVVVVAHSAGAQTSARRAVVAIPDNFPETDAKALVIRYADPAVGDVILLRRSDATPTILGAAFRLLTRLRATDPTPLADEVTSIAGAAQARGNRTAAAAYWNNVLARVHARPTARIGNLGAGRWIAVNDLLSPQP